MIFCRQNTSIKRTYVQNRFKINAGGYPNEPTLVWLIGKCQKTRHGQPASWRLVTPPSLFGAKGLYTKPAAGRAIRAAYVVKLFDTVRGQQTTAFSDANGGGDGDDANRRRGAVRHRSRNRHEVHNSRPGDGHRVRRPRIPKARANRPTTPKCA
ncbi:hypothetical protein A1507_03340 [Methylomonas koyamae]|uniref:Uncharacterized protein n=1 Tax=Methylomonas koyamae TaxID=702114 RepID=A0A177N123_9GAMM|nr:hypothetical protein A1507_03340 [Methylomonas koyamae]